MKLHSFNNIRNCASDLSDYEKDVMTRLLIVFSVPVNLINF